MAILSSLLRSRLSGTTGGQDVDWADLDEDNLIQAASRHAVTALAYDAVAALPTAPATLKTSFRRAAEQETLRVCALTADLIQVCKVLEDAEVPALVLKGPVLSTLAFGCPAARSFSDIDVFVPKQDVGRALESIRGMGFAPADERWSAAAGSKDVTLYHSETGTCVELHWELYVDLIHVPSDFGSAWRRRQSVRIAGVLIQTLGTADTYLYLCVHGAVHAWSHLKWLYDVAGLLQSGHVVNWPELLHRATARGCLRMLLTGISAACDLFSLEIPHALIQPAASDRVVKKLAAQIVRDILTTGGPVRRPDLSHPMSYRERTRDKLAILGIKVQDKWRPTQADQEWMQLPDSLRCLHVLARPVRLARTYGFTWLRSFLSVAVAHAIFNTCRFIADPAQQHFWLK